MDFIKCVVIKLEENSCGNTFLRNVIEKHDMEIKNKTSKSKSLHLDSMLPILLVTSRLPEFDNITYAISAKN